MSSLKFALSVPVAAGLLLGATACGSGNPTVKASRSAVAAAEQAKNAVTSAATAVASAVPTVTVPVAPTATASAAAKTTQPAGTVKWGSACKTTGAKSKTQYGTKVTCKWYQGKRVWR